MDLESNVLQLVDQLLLPGLVYEPGVVGGLGQGGVVTSLQLVLIPSDLVLRNLVGKILNKPRYVIISGIEQYKWEERQAGTELCQAQTSLSHLKLATN